MADGVSGDGSRPGGGLSTAELVHRAGEQISQLIRDEVALARAELAQQARRAGAAAGLFGAGGLVALYGLGALVLAAVAGVATALPLWLAALLVGAALLVVAGLLALAGRRLVGRAVPPGRAVTRSVQADLAAVTAAVQDRRLARPAVEVAGDDRPPEPAGAPERDRT